MEVEEWEGGERRKAQAILEALFSMPVVFMYAMLPQKEIWYRPCHTLAVPLLSCPVFQRKHTCSRRMNCKLCTPAHWKSSRVLVRRERDWNLFICSTLAPQASSPDKKSRHHRAHLLSEHLGGGGFIVQSQLGLQNGRV